MKLTYPIAVPSRISARFDEPRPLSTSSDKRDHIHGAIDIAAPVGTPILAPEAGTLFYWRALRPKEGAAWPETAPELGGIPFPYVNYFYDMYGTLSVLIGVSGLVHVFAHSYFRQIFERENWGWTFVEQKEDARFVFEAMHTFGRPKSIGEGALVAKVGNAGFSTGAHLHWEIHKGLVWTPHAERPDPESFCQEARP